MIEMGFVSQILRLLGLESDRDQASGLSQKQSQRQPESPESGMQGIAGNGFDDWVRLEHDGQRYNCQVEESPNGSFQTAYADGRPGDGEPIHGIVFCFEEGARNFAVDIERPNEVAVSNTGTVAVADWEFGWGDGGLCGTFHVFGRRGGKHVTERFDSNLGPCAVTPDGSYAAVSTLNPDCSTYLFDVGSGEQIAQHENEGGNKQKLEFEETESGWQLGLSDSKRDEPAYRINLSGEVVWRTEKDNLRGDVGELIKRVQEGGQDRMATSDLCAVARQSPKEITPYLETLLGLVEDGVFETISGKGGEINVNTELVFTSVAEAEPNEYDPYLNRLLNNIRGETSSAAAVVSTSILVELAGQEHEPLVSSYGDVVDLLQHESRDVQQRAVTIIKADVSQFYDQMPEVAGQLGDKLHAEDDLAFLRDIVSTLTTLLDERPEASERLESVTPRAVELLSIGDADYQYGDVETYDYKDQTHYDTNHLHRTVPQLLVALAPVYSEEVAKAVPTLLTMVRQSGQRNTSLRSTSSRALTAVAEHSCGAAQSELEAEFNQIISLLDHEDERVQKTAVELLVALKTPEAQKELNNLLGSENDELASAAKRGLQTVNSATPMDPEVARLTPAGDDSIERQQRRFDIQTTYEYLQAEGSARKQHFISEVYDNETYMAEDKWWRVVRDGLKSIESVELSGNTYSYTGQ